jgi:hypothetical protein
LPAYIEFFSAFHPTEEHQQDIYSLGALLQLALEIKADMTWVAKMDKPITILVDAAWLDTDNQVTVAGILC